MIREKNTLVYRSDHKRLTFPVITLLNAKIGMFSGLNIIAHPTRTQDASQTGKQQSRSACPEESSTQILTGQPLSKMEMGWIEVGGQGTNQGRSKCIPK